jgi:hypothetical protein
MLAFYLLILLQAGVCSFLLLGSWERRQAGGRALGTALAVGLVCFAGAVSLLLSFSPRWFAGWSFVVGVIFMIVGYLLHSLLLRRQRERATNAHGQPSLLSELVWQAVCAGGAVFIVILCVQLARWFNTQYPVPLTQAPIPTRLLGASLALGVCSGGLLLAATARGALCGVGLARGGEPRRALAEALNETRLVLIFVLFLRLVALLFSLWVWARFDAGAMRRFFDLGADGVTMFSMMRILLGILMPALSVGSIGLSIAAGELRAARWYFVLLFVFVLIGEGMALTLTAGLRGIAF